MQRLGAASLLSKPLFEQNKVSSGPYVIKEHLHIQCSP